MFSWPNHADAMQIFSFCMANFGTKFYPVFSMDYGALEEIRTPDPQIRSLERGSSMGPQEIA
jgi:hypothetical protein